MYDFSKASKCHGVVYQISQVVPVSYADALSREARQRGKPLNHARCRGDSARAAQGTLGLLYSRSRGRKTSASRLGSARHPQKGRLHIQASSSFT